MNSLVSIIMPVYNAEAFVEDAIESVVAQTHTHWELIIVNDGSTDRSTEIIARYRNNARMLLFYQENKGVSSARNLGLSQMKGDYFCFLDADDVLPRRSIESRLIVLKQNPSLFFADGAIEFFESETGNVRRLYKPEFTGNPLKELLRLGDKCFGGLTWMIRRLPGTYAMREDVRHGEDLLFFMELARQGGNYGYTKEIVLRYRQHTHSAMKNLDGLLHGYQQIFKYVSGWEEFNWYLKFVFKIKVKKFMCMDYLKRKEFGKALTVLVK